MVEVAFNIFQSFETFTFAALCIFSGVAMMKLSYAQASVIAISMFFLVSFAHIYNRSTDMAEDQVNLPAKHLPKTPMLAFASLGVSLAPFIVWPRLMPARLLVWHVVGAIISYMYSTPIKVGGKSHRLKEILVVKNLTAVSGFLIAPLFLPYAASDLQEFPWMFLAAMTLHFWATEILGDLGDVKGDALAGVHTIPLAIGATKTKIVLAVFWLGSIVLAFPLPRMVFLGWTGFVASAWIFYLVERFLRPLLVDEN